MSNSFIDITRNNYDAVHRTLEHLDYRIRCQNRQPSADEAITLKVLCQELAELVSVLKLHNAFKAN